MPLTDSLTPFAEYGMQSRYGVCIYENGKYAARFACLQDNNFYSDEAFLVEVKNGGLRGS